MKKFKQLFVFVLIFSICVISVTETHVNAKNTKDSEYVISKKLLEKEHKAEKREFKEEEKLARQKELDSLILESLANGVDVELLDTRLEADNIYRLKSEEVVSIKSVGSSDITFTTPYQYYDGATGEWVIVGGGYWKNDNWKNDASIWQQLTCPLRSNLGGTETIGLALHNVSGTYRASMVSAMGYYSDGSGYSNYMYNPNNNNYEYGIMFNFQDEITDSTPGDANWSDWKYRGKHFSALARYSNNFSAYNGNVNFFYGHTWSSVSVSSVTLSNTGASISFTSGTEKWNIYSTDASF